MKKGIYTISLALLVVSSTNSQATVWSESSWENYNDQGMYDSVLEGGNDINNTSVQTTTSYGDNAEARGLVDEYVNVKAYASSTDSYNDNYYSASSTTTGMSFSFTPAADGHVSFSIYFDADLYFNRDGSYKGESYVGATSSLTWKDLYGTNYGTEESWNASADIGYFTSAYSNFYFNVNGDPGSEVIDDHLYINTSYTFNSEVYASRVYTINFNVQAFVKNNNISENNSNSTAYVDAWNTMGFGADGTESFWQNVVSDVALHSTTNPDTYFYEPNIPSAVPEPATMLLFATGLAGFAGINRRTKK